MHLPWTLAAAGHSTHVAWYICCCDCLIDAILQLLCRKQPAGTAGPVEIPTPAAWVHAPAHVVTAAGGCV